MSENTIMAKFNVAVWDGEGASSEREDTLYDEFDEAYEINVRKALEDVDELFLGDNMGKETWPVSEVERALEDEGVEDIEYSERTGSSGKFLRDFNIGKAPYRVFVDMGEESSTDDIASSLQDTVERWNDKYQRGMRPRVVGE